MKKNREMFMANDVRICQMSNHLITICSASHLWQKSNLQPLPRKRQKSPHFLLPLPRKKRRFHPELGRIFSAHGPLVFAQVPGGREMWREDAKPQNGQDSWPNYDISPTQISLKEGWFPLQKATIWGFWVVWGCDEIWPDRMPSHRFQGQQIKALHHRF